MATMRSAELSRLLEAYSMASKFYSFAVRQSDASDQHSPAGKEDMRRLTDYAREQCFSAREELRNYLGEESN
jgi:hypothetical protein